MPALPETAPIVVFSDLDGTLLDHETYSWDAARPALKRLARIQAPVVLASSKTASEITVLQKEMGLSHWPAIVENGAGVLGERAPPTYASLRGVLAQVQKALRQQFRGFGDMSASEIAQVTGLSLVQAERAGARQFSEPGIWRGSEAECARFQTALAAHGIAVRRGGRFLTLSFGGTKSDRMEKVTARFQPRHTIALGDAPNDVEMLEAADYAVIVANSHSSSLPMLKNEAGGRVIRTEETGPLGWNRSMMELLDRLGFGP